MDIKAVTRILGALLVFLGVSLILPLCCSLYYNDGDLYALLISMAIALLTGFAVLILTPKKPNLRIREGFGVVTFGWVTLALFGALPFVFAGVGISFTDAFFETMSGFTTTGATIFQDVESLPHGLLFWRSLTHWLGGMGIIVLSLAILPMLGVGGMQLFKAEVPGPSVDKLQPRIQDTAKILWGVYVLISAVEAILLKLGGMSVFDSLCHTFGTMATGGFSTKNIGIAHFQSAYIEYVILIFMVLAGINFALHYQALKGNLRQVLKNTELRIYVTILAAMTLFIFFQLRFGIYSGTEISIRKAAFQTASLMTTTGFHSADYETWTIPSQLILVLLMFVGGCAGSTAGGIKVVRIYLTFKNGLVQLRRLLHPHAVIPLKLGRNTISRDAILSVQGFLLLYFFILIISSVVMALMGLDLVTSVSTVISSLSNIGPGVGAIGPTENFAFIPAPGKWLLSFLMLAGRLEIFTVLVIFSRDFWLK